MCNSSSRVSKHRIANSQRHKDEDRRRGRDPACYRTLSLVLASLESLLDSPIHLQQHHEKCARVG